MRIKWALPFLVFASFLVFFRQAPLQAQPLDKKYCICHNQPNKNPQTLVVPANSVCTHVNKHGDTSGPCPGDPPSACKGAPGIEDIDCDQPICGDGSCGSGETCETCEADCGGCDDPFCGDLTCDPPETCFTCAIDCNGCRSFGCGDGICSLLHGESCSNCRQDCGLCGDIRCSDLVCSGKETCHLCQEDCGSCLEPYCGDGVCDQPSENCLNCSKDCSSCDIPHCGDGNCGPLEFCLTCPGDCGTCPDFPTPDCGDGYCEYPFESCSDCETDCGGCDGPTCGDEICDSGEFCSTCPSDCGKCYCDDRDGDEICDYIDNCPDTANPLQADVNQDGIGDACESLVIDFDPKMIQCVKILKNVGFDLLTAIRLARANVCGLAELEGSGSAFSCSLRPLK